MGFNSILDARRQQSRVVISGVGIVTPLGCGWIENSNGFRDSINALSPVTLFDVTKQKAKIACNTEIYERDNYTPFGIGYRRCPGEFLSMEFLEEIAWFLKDKKIDISLKNGVSIKKHYVFDLKENNYIVKFVEIN